MSITHKTLADLINNGFTTLSGIYNHSTYFGSLCIRKITTLSIKNPVNQNIYKAAFSTSGLSLSLAVLEVNKRPYKSAAYDLKNKNGDGDGEGQNSSASSEDSDSKSSKSSFTFKDLLELLKPHSLKLIISVLCAIASAYYNIQIPITLGHLIDKISTFLNTSTVLTFSEFYAVIQQPILHLSKLYICQAAATFGMISSLFNLGEALSSQIKYDLFSELVNYELAYFDKKMSQDLCQVIDSDVQDFKHSFKKIFSNGIKASTQILGCGFSLYSTSSELTTALGLGLPVMVLTGRLLSSGLRSLSKKSRQDTAEAAAFSGENIEQIKTIKVFNAENSVSKIYSQKLDKIQDSNAKFGLGLAGFQALTNLALNSIVGVTIAYGGWLLNQNKLTGGDLMAFVTASQMIQRSLASVSQIASEYIKMSGAGERIFEVRKHKQEIDKKYLIGNSTIPFYSLLADLSFENINFSYPTRPDAKVLDGVSFKVQNSQVVAFVGHTGSGKSTLASLLLRLYEPSSGKILLDNKPLNTFSSSWLRSKVIATVSQEPTLFNMTIFENIKFGNPQATNQEVYEAAEKANCNEFISRLPDGFETNVGERGSQLSGGQKQRVAIARALIKNPSILILDEATSALDSYSEHLVQDAINKATAGKTVIIIAHRLSTIKNADNIVVLDGGKVCQMGTHEELMRDVKGRYFRLNENQQS